MPIPTSYHGTLSCMCALYHASTHSPTTTPNEKPTFTTEEYTQLMALLRKENGNTPPFANPTCIVTPTCYNTVRASHSTLYWIVDSGAVATKTMIALVKQHKRLYYITRQQNPHLVHHVNLHSSL
ncbi:hypothetical protein L3X38_037627 [Prunus dulcis]|uniref:Uncharacterized protein n=1 Tax=Prunus dulcis TaxID=3755 RepID=A0AAD4YQT3_PRUDU|nr:hypothetical protein L3X38_037627 [Prunus dulcis]